MKIPLNSTIFFIISIEFKTLTQLNLIKSPPSLPTHSEQVHGHWALGSELSAQSVRQTIQTIYILYINILLYYNINILINHKLPLLIQYQ